jgi:hypothetical protein
MTSAPCLLSFNAEVAQGATQRLDEDEGYLRGTPRAAMTEFAVAIAMPYGFAWPWP